MGIENEATDSYVVPATEPAEYHYEPAENEASPIMESEVRAPISNALAGLIRTCRHCGAEFSTTLKKCPACDKHQTGAPTGPRPSTTQKRRGGKPVKEPPSPEDILKLESAVGDTFAFVCEDILARRVTGLTIPPPFGETRAARIGAVWAPILAPYISGPFMLALLAIVITFRGLSSYYTECLRAKEAHENATKAQ